MTCGDCKHFYEKELKPWYVEKGVGLCDNCRGGHGTIQVLKDCPANRWCDNKFEKKESSWESVSK